MICKNCGKEYDDAYQFCPYCGNATEYGMRYCPQCGKSLDGNISECPHCHWHADVLPYKLSRKKLATAMTFLRFLGLLGAHRFYVGRAAGGIFMLASFIAGFVCIFLGLVRVFNSLSYGFVLMIIGFIALIIDCILFVKDRYALFTGTFTDSDGLYLS